MRLRVWLWIDGIAFRRVSALIGQEWWRDYQTGEVTVGKGVVTSGAADLAAKFAATQEP